MRQTGRENGRGQNTIRGGSDPIAPQRLRCAGCMRSYGRLNVALSDDSNKDLSRAVGSCNDELRDDIR